MRLTPEFAKELHDKLAVFEVLPSWSEDHESQIMKLLATGLPGILVALKDFGKIDALRTEVAESSRIANERIRDVLKLEAENARLTAEVEKLQRSMTAHFTEEHLAGDGPEIDRWKREVERLTRELAEAQENIGAMADDRRQFVPGRWICDNCGFVLSRTSISFATGNIGTTQADREEPEECANAGRRGCGQMRRVSWEDAYRDAAETQTKLVDMVLKSIDLMKLKPEPTLWELEGGIRAKIADLEARLTAATNPNVNWSSAKTVGQLVSQLSTLSPETEINTAYTVEIWNKRLTKVSGVTLSWERRTKEQTLDYLDQSVPRSIIIWATLSPERESENDQLKQQVERLTKAAKALTTAMESCHYCKATVLVADHATYCEDCPRGCEHHDAPDCLTIEDLHRELKSLAPAESESASDEYPDVLTRPIEGQKS